METDGPYLAESSQNPFSRYCDRLFDPCFSFFMPWDISQIEKDEQLWNPSPKWLYVSVTTKSPTFHAEVSCSSKPNRRIIERRTKKKQENNIPLTRIAVPPIRNFSAKQIKNHVRTGRGLRSKCEKSIRVAQDRGLYMAVSPVLTNPNSPYYNENIASSLPLLAPPMDEKK